MTSLSRQFWLEVETVLVEKLAVLQSHSFTELSVLPEASDHGSMLIGGREVSFTLFAWQRDPGVMIVVMQAAVHGWLGFWRSYEKGFIAFEDGIRRPTTQKELESVL